MLAITLGAALSGLLLKNVHAASARRTNVFLDLSQSSSTIQTQISDTTDGATTNVTLVAAKLGVDYFVGKRFAAVAQLLLPLVVSIDAEVKGYDVGIRYYPFKPGYQSELKLLESKLETTPGFASFLYGGFSSRDYQFSNTNISFYGIELGAGMDYHFANHYFLRGSLSYQKLQNTTKRELISQTIGLGGGYSF